MCIDFLMVLIFWMSTLATVLLSLVLFDFRNFHRFFPDHNGIHDAIYHCANLQRMPLICLVYTYLRLSGINTCDGMNRSQSMANRIVIFPNDAMDERNVYHQRSKSWCFLRKKWGIFLLKLLFELGFNLLKLWVKPCLHLGEIFCTDLWKNSARKNFPTWK